MSYDPTKTIHFISSPAHRKALDHLEAVLYAAETWLRPALTAVPCQEEFSAFLAQIATAKQYLITGKTR